MRRENGAGNTENRIFTKIMPAIMVVYQCLDVGCCMNTLDIRTKSQMIAMCMNTTSISPQNTLMAGESILNQKGTEECGVSFLGVTY